MKKTEARNNDEGRMTNSQDLDEAFWLQGPALRLQEEAAAPRIFDLEERTPRVGEPVIDFAKLIPRVPLTDRLISQLVGCGTSVGGNYCEADEAVSRKEFFLRAGTCRKESREAKHFVRMVMRGVPVLKEDARPLWQEAKEPAKPE